MIVSPHRQGKSGTDKTSLTNPSMAHCVRTVLLTIVIMMMVIMIILMIMVIMAHCVRTILLIMMMARDVDDDHDVCH